MVEQPINSENTVSVMSISESNTVGVDENSNLYKALDPDAEVSFSITYYLLWFFYLITICLVQN